MRVLKPTVVIFFALLFINPVLTAALVVNEVMVNEPGGATSLEWFELYNDSPNDIVSMSLYTVTVNTATVTFGSFPLAANSYLVICRDTLAFKNHWGSRVPGDIKLYQASFSLPNTGSGSLLLYRAGVLHSVLSWPDGGADGYSWERISSIADEIGPSVDRLGCTPGFINSLTPVPFDLALENIFVRSYHDTTWLTYLIVNRGENVISDGVLHLFYYNESDSTDETDVIGVIDIPPVETGYTAVINEPYLLDGRYVHLGAALDDDNRNRNNRLYFYAPGSQYPPFVLSEILPDPAPGSLLNSEWIEIKNRFDESIPLTGWQIGDQNNIYDITNEDIIIEPYEYFVLVEDSLSFLSFYPQYSGRLIIPVQWPRLNNNYDVVRLADSFTFVADTFAYSKVFGSNYTWARSETTGPDVWWGRSENPGGTPGEENSVLFEPRGGKLSLVIEPQIISPDGDGYEDEARITFEGPTGPGYTLKLYDRKGTLIKTFFEDEAIFKEAYYWDGRAGDGRRLPIGIYIVYLEAEGSGEIKKTVVLAR
ncbi:MAG: lamin tail domain-containing protein [candidate division Zixibacteria bacterium]|nr:lamin tail domain-containing protein [candidate division Zixibacteria bacterium]MDD5426542.1 lamin tail domain-containing protein [candidate division Zixibacteria bacterium]